MLNNQTAEISAEQKRGTFVPLFLVLFLPIGVSHTTDGQRKELLHLI